MNERAIIAFFFIFVLVILTNLLMFGIVRSFLQGGPGRSDFLQRLLNRPFHGRKPPIDELRDRVSELQEAKPSPDTKLTLSEQERTQAEPGLNHDTF